MGVAYLTDSAIVCGGILAVRAQQVEDTIRSRGSGEILSPMSYPCEIYGGRQPAGVAGLRCRRPSIVSMALSLIAD